jgi:hypothetical protein
MEIDKNVKKQHFVENNIKIMQYVFNTQSISLLPKYIKWIYRNVYLHVFVFRNAGIEVVKTEYKRDVCWSARKFCASTIRDFDKTVYSTSTQ